MVATLVDGEVEILRGYELRLLRCTVSLPQSDLPLESQSGTHPHETLISSLLSSIEAGDYLCKTFQQLICKTESTSEIWGLYARWSRVKGDLMVCSEALLKQVRSYQGSEVWKDKERFKKFAGASFELCRVYMEISVSTRSKRELFSAEMHLKTTIKQATVSFSDTEELKELESCLEEVRNVMQKKSEERD